MDHEDKLQLLWAASFVVSGVIFAIALYITPMVGLFAMGYIVLYVGLALAFMMIFRHINSIAKESVESLKERKREVEEIEKEIEKKFYKKKIDKETYNRMMQDYEKQLTELDVRIRNLQRRK